MTARDFDAMERGIVRAARFVGWRGVSVVAESPEGATEALLAQIGARS